MCVTWLVCMCDVTHSWVWHKSFISVTWFIHMRAMNSASSLLPSAKFSELNFTVLLYSKLRSELTFENLYMPPAMLLKLHTCNTLQHTATYCNILKYTATHCSNTLPHTATHCNTLQHTAAHYNTKHTLWICAALLHSRVQHASFMCTTQYDDFLCAACLVHKCDLTHSYVLQDPLICVTRRIHVPTATLTSAHTPV